MTIFSWEGDIDTIMKPIDSIRYYKHFLQAGMMSMNPKNGHVMAWVGGIDYRNFQYDHVMQSKETDRFNIQTIFICHCYRST